MDLVKFVQENWVLLSLNPLIFFLFFIFSVSIGFTIAKWYYSKEISVLKEKYLLAKDQTDALTDGLRIEMQNMRTELLSKIPKVYSYNKAPAKHIKYPPGTIIMIDPDSPSPPEE